MGPGWDPARKKWDPMTTRWDLCGKNGTRWTRIGDPASKKRDPVTTQMWDPEDPDGARLAKNGKPDGTCVRKTGTGGTPVTTQMGLVWEKWDPVMT